MLDKIKDPVSCLTHLGGAVASLGVLVLLISLAVPHGAVYTLSFAIFGASLILLYSASAIYHMLDLGEKNEILRRIDHTMIFYLIAGTYTPVCLVALPGAWRWSILGTIWGLAVAGTFMKIFWLRAPRWLSTMIYVIMGWLVVVAFVPLFRAISGGSFALLLAGGLCYTAGALIYALKRPRLNIPGLGFHEIFHIFVLAGSAFHVLFTLTLLP